MKGLPGDTLVSTGKGRPEGGPGHVYAGLDLSRKRLDVHLLEGYATARGVMAVSPEAPRPFGPSSSPQPVTVRRCVRRSSR
jgi:hypothetical protein